MLPSLGFHHVGLVVSDLDASLAWYAKHLGLKERSRDFLEGPGLAIVYAEAPGMVVEFFQLPGSQPLRPEDSDLMASFGFQGYRHLAFATDDVDAAWQAIVDAGLPQTTPPSFNEALGVRYCFTTDPDGNLIEFAKFV